MVQNSDVACLAEEQFLNDQIIDFWLRYFLDSLPDDQKDKAYVYNTFFYKRLTTRPRRKSSAPWEFDPGLSPSEKRHARVKSWTKKIDIFDKEFLFIPINEKYEGQVSNHSSMTLRIKVKVLLSSSAHWFLAVICFPGLLCPVAFRDNNLLPYFKNVQTKKDKRKIRANSCGKRLQMRSASFLRALKFELGHTALN